MNIDGITELISTVGFPIFCVIFMGWFIYEMIKKTNEQNEKAMDKVQAECKIREDKLYEEIKENREINSKAIDTIARYSEKLDNIQNDINGIKTNMTVLTTKIQ